MKTKLNALPLLALMMLMLVAVSCGGGMKSKVVGNWELVKAGGEDAAKAEASIEFKKDGTFEQRARGRARKGKWELDEKNKTINLSPEEGDKEKMTDITFDKEMMTCNNDGKKLELKKKK